MPGGERYHRKAHGMPYSAHKGIFFAVRIAERYRDRIPTVQQLVHDFNMSRATAFRWIAAIKAARGKE